MMPVHLRQLIGILNKWQDENDLRPSEMLDAMMSMAGHYAPTSRMADVSAAIELIHNGNKAKDEVTAPQPQQIPQTNETTS
jgi:hypothetical protein